MRIGLLGFSRVGKSTLFGLLTGGGASPTVRRGGHQVGVARVPDPRLDHLSSLYRPRKTTPATVEYLDLAAVEEGAAAEALPLEALRGVDALAHVVRAFRNGHDAGELEPAGDVDAMETELILADHGIAERRVEKLAALVLKGNREEEARELALMRRCLEALERGVPLRNLEFDSDERRRLRGYTFLSMKPLLVVVNADEADASKLDAGAAAFGLKTLDERPATRVVPLAARFESELASLAPADAAAFRDEIGIRTPALDRMIRSSYELLGRLSFFTVGEDECRAWTLRRDTRAREAAGTIHEDLARGFIRAEVVSYDDLVAAGSWSACRSRGSLRLEGKDYVVRDGDVINFRFAV
jgi:GTP-binding protein YchF